MIVIIIISYLNIAKQAICLDMSQKKKSRNFNYLLLMVIFIELTNKN